MVGNWSVLPADCWSLDEWERRTSWSSTVGLEVEEEGMLLWHASMVSQRPGNPDVVSAKNGDSWPRASIPCYTHILPGSWSFLLRHTQTHSLAVGHLDGYSRRLMSSDEEEVLFSVTSRSLIRPLGRCADKRSTVPLSVGWLVRRQTYENTLICFHSNPRRPQNEKSLSFASSNQPFVMSQIVLVFGPPEGPTKIWQKVVNGVLNDPLTFSFHSWL